jgi:molybdenum cofactor guanylyltransferase
MRIAGCILAGGKSRRMGANKATMLLKNKTLLDHAVERLHGQVDLLSVNANQIAGTTRYPIIADEHPDYAGPLAGVLAGLNWATSLTPKVDALVTTPVDAPFFPFDLVSRLLSVRDTTVTVARCAGQLHPVFALWPLETEGPMREWMRDKNNRSIKAFLAFIPHHVVDFPEIEGFDPFTNINTPDELAAAETHIQTS